jgi:hypothetical protein
MLGYSAMLAGVKKITDFSKSHLRDQYCGRKVKPP